MKAHEKEIYLYRATELIQINSKVLESLRIIRMIESFPNSNIPNWASHETVENSDMVCQFLRLFRPEMASLNYYAGFDMLPIDKYLNIIVVHGLSENLKF